MGDLHPLLDGDKVIDKGLKTRLRYLMPSLTQSLMAIPVVLRLPSPLTWETGMGSRMKAP